MNERQTPETQALTRFPCSMSEEIVSAKDCARLEQQRDEARGNWNYFAKLADENGAIANGYRKQRDELLEALEWFVNCYEDGLLSPCDTVMARSAIAAVKGNQ